MKRRRLKDPFLQRLIHFVWAGIWLLVVAVVVTRYRVWLSESGTFQVQKIEVLGNDLIDPETFTQQDDLDMDQSVWQVDLVHLERKIGKNPFIAHVHLYRDIPDGLCVRIEEKKPVALLHFEDDLYCIDADGLVLPSKPGRLYDLPILTGSFKGGVAVGSRVGGEWIEEGLEFLQSVKTDRPQLFGSISEIVLGNPEGLILYLREEGIPVRVGQGQYVWKMRYLEAILNELTTVEDPEKIDHIDLRFKGQIIVGMRA